MADFAAVLAARAAESDAVRAGHAHRTAYYADGLRWMCATLDSTLDAAAREHYVQRALRLASPWMRFRATARDLEDPEVRLLVRLIYFRMRLPEYGADSLATDAEWEAWIAAL